MSAITIPIKVRPMLVSGMLASSTRGPVILIDSEQPELQQVIALWHEVLHLLGVTDEATVESIAVRLADADPGVLRLVHRNINVPGDDVPPDTDALQANLDAAIAGELDRAVAKFPTWPTDPLHALAVLGEEFGELTKEMLQLTYEPHKTSPEEVRKEALQTAAMALRLYRSLDVYEYKPGPQHAQR